MKISELTGAQMVFNGIPANLREMKIDGVIVWTAPDISTTTSQDV